MKAVLPEKINQKNTTFDLQGRSDISAMAVKTGTNIFIPQ